MSEASIRANCRPDSGERPVDGNIPELSPDSRFRALADAIPQLAWMTDASGWIYWYNQRWFDYTGTTLEEMQGWGWQKVHHPDHVQRVTERIQRSFDTGEPWEDTFPLRAKDGVYRWFLSRALPIRGNDGNIGGWLGTNTDITDRLEAEKALRQSEERFRRALEIETVGVSFFKTGGEITGANDAFLRMTGYRHEDVAAGHLRWDELTPSEWMPHSLRAIEELTATGRTTPYEKECFRKDGSRWWGLFAATRVSETEGVEFILDISDRIRQSRRQHALAETAVRVNSTLSIEEPVQDILQAVSDAAADIIGAHLVTVSMTSGNNWAKVVQAVSLSEKYAAWRTYDERPNGAGIYSEVCRTNRPMRLTSAELIAHPLFRGFGAAAATHPPLRGWLCVPLIGRDGRNLGALHAADKFTGDFTAEDEAVALQLATIAAAAMENCAAYQEVRDADRRKDQFLAVLAHELRNPLTPILAAAGVLRMAETHDPQVQRVSDVLERQGKQLTRLIEDLLDASRIGRGKITLIKETVELAAVIERVMDAVRLAIEDRRLVMTVSLPPEPLTLDVDTARLTQVLCNLLLNAVKYTEPEGRIWVTAAPEQNDVVISVRDTGIGMSEEFVARAFDMFSQAEHGQSYARGGLGIGLSLVRRLVEMHGGTVAAHSDGLQKGSEFIVRLPRVARDSR
jgi:PAS domain S-box-containing protein